MKKEFGFDYEDMVKKRALTDEANNYTLSTDDVFFQIKFYDPAREPGYNAEADHGWKIHISICDEINDENAEIDKKSNLGRENLSKGWDIAKNILLNNRVGLVKVVRPERIPFREKTGNLMVYDTNKGFHFRNELGMEAGKQITIYAFRQPHLNWNNIVTEITTEFIAAGIQPSCLPFGNEPIKNNPYFSYRNDLRHEKEINTNNRYMHVTGYSNPLGHPPIFTFQEEIYPNAPKVPTWEDVTKRKSPEPFSRELIDLLNKEVQREKEESTKPVEPSERVVSLLSPEEMLKKYFSTEKKSQGPSSSKEPQERSLSREIEKEGTSSSSEETEEETSSSGEDEEDSSSSSEEPKEKISNINT